MRRPFHIAQYGRDLRQELLIATMSTRIPLNGRLLSEGQWVIAIVLLGFALRVISVIVLDIHPESDFATYQFMANSFLNGKGFVDDTGNYAMYNVGYPLFVLSPTMALLGRALLPIQIVNATLGSLTVFLCYAIARQTDLGKAGRLISPFLCAVYVPSWVYAEYLAKENLMTPLMLGIVWCAFKLTKASSAVVATVCGILFGLLALTGNAGLSLAAVIVLALILSPSRIAAKLLALFMIVLLGGAIAAPWIIRNMHLLGVPVLNTNSGFNLYLGNNPSANGYFLSISETPRGSTWEALRRTGEVQASETLKHEAVEWIMEHPRNFAELAIRKACLFWTPPFHQGNGSGSTVEKVMRAVWLLEFSVLVFSTLASLLFSAGRTRYSAILWLSLGSYSAVHMLFYVVFRYREPVMPLLCVIASISFDALWMTGNTRPSQSIRRQTLSY